MKNVPYRVYVLLLLMAGCMKPPVSGIVSLPAIRADGPLAHYSISGEAERGWNINPRIERDTLLVRCYRQTENLVFKTDSDSIHIPVSAGQTKIFYVRLKDSVKALTVVHGVSPYQSLAYAKDEMPNDSIRSWYGFHSGGYRDTLQHLYPVVLPAKYSDDISRIAAILEWTHNQWKHNGNNSPKKNDAVSILDEVKTGGEFPCFAFSIVLAAELNAAGYLSRVLYLKGKDVETNKVVPGHVVTEVYVPSLHKWAFLDGQFNVMPVLKGVPLNAVEFQKAFGENYAALSFYNNVNYNGSTWTKRNYADFVYPYLFFFDYYFDSRSGVGTAKTIQGKKGLMLVPAGIKPPVKFGAFDGLIDYCIYTHDAEKFYAEP